MAHCKIKYFDRNIISIYPFGNRVMPPPPNRMYDLLSYCSLDVISNHSLPSLTTCRASSVWLKIHVSDISPCVRNVEFSRVACSGMRALFLVHIKYLISSINAHKIPCGNTTCHSFGVMSLDYRHTRDLGTYRSIFTHSQLHPYNQIQVYSNLTCSKYFYIIMSL